MISAMPPHDLRHHLRLISAMQESGDAGAARGRSGGSKGAGGSKRAAAAASLEAPGSGPHDVAPPSSSNKRARGRAAAAEAAASAASASAASASAASAASASLQANLEWQRQLSRQTSGGNGGAPGGGSKGGVLASPGGATLSAVGAPARVAAGGAGLPLHSRLSIHFVAQVCAHCLSFGTAEWLVPLCPLLRTGAAASCTDQLLPALCERRALSTLLLFLQVIATDCHRLPLIAAPLSAGDCH